MEEATDLYVFFMSALPALGVGARERANLALSLPRAPNKLEKRKINGADSLCASF